MQKIRHTASSLFNSVYDVGILLKGIDGFIEFLTGVLLLIAPGLVHKLLTDVAGKAAVTHHQTFRLIGDYVARLDKELAASGLAFLIIFLLTHGVVKLVLVYCLLKKIVKVYPFALIILGLFLIYQVYAFIQTPSVGLALFSLLDAVIIGLVWREYKILLFEKVV